MLDLLSRDPECQSADRPVALLAAYLFLAAMVVGAVLAGVPFHMRGERPGIWALAPLAGALLALAAGGMLGVDSGLLRVALCAAGAAAYTWLLARVERAYEAAIRLLPAQPPEPPEPPEPPDAEISVRREPDRSAAPAGGAG